MTLITNDLFPGVVCSAHRGPKRGEAPVLRYLEPILGRSKARERQRTSRQRVSFTKWYSQFKRLAEGDCEVSKILNSASVGAFYSVVGETVPMLLYMYVCGAPTATQLTRPMKQNSGAEIAGQMEKLAAAIREFDCGPTGPSLSYFLQKLTDGVTDFHHGAAEPLLQRCLEKMPGTDLAQIGRIAEAYISLPDVLSTLAVFIKANIRNSTSLFSPPDRKLVQTRALVMLYCHISSCGANSDYRTTCDLAKLLRPAYEAANPCDDVGRNTGHDTPQNRIRRFKKQRPQEFSVLKQIVESAGLNDASIRTGLLLPILREN